MEVPALLLLSGSHLEVELEVLLSPEELLLRGGRETAGGLFFSPAELLREKGQKDRGEMGNLQLEDTLLSLDDGISLEDDGRRNFLGMKRSLSLLEYLEGALGEVGTVAGREKDLEGDGQRELVRLMQLR